MEHDNDNPIWHPLEQVAKEFTCSTFMFMGIIQHDNKEIKSYKAKNTRQYLHLDDQGVAYHYNNYKTMTPLTEKEKIKYLLSILNEEYQGYC